MRLVQTGRGNIEKLFRLRSIMGNDKIARDYIREILCIWTVPYMLIYGYIVTRVA